MTLGRVNVPEDAAGPFELASTQLGALPVIGLFLERIDLAGTLERHLPAGDARTTLPAATAIGVLVCNLCVAREPLYGLAGWAAGFEPGLLGLESGEAGLLNDDRVGRALDQLFDADRSSLRASWSCERSASSGSTARSYTTIPRRWCCTVTTTLRTAISVAANRPSWRHAGIPRIIVPI